MGKKEKPKAKANKARQLGLANETVTSPKSSPVPFRRSKDTVIASESIPRPPLRKEPENIAASTDVPVASMQPLAIRQVDVTLGQIVTIFMRSAQHKQRPLADLEWLVLPAVLSGQCRVAQAQQSSIVVPVGVALWANVSTDVDQRLSDLSAPWRLQPDEWRSGDIPWLVELVADTSTQQALLKHLGETVFKGRRIRMRVRDANGKTQIGTFKGAGAA
jgi:hemolysin-activating ACP:hemolysin acyltransferase